jgi:hypothetical protein
MVEQKPACGRVKASPATCLWTTSDEGNVTIQPPLDGNIPNAFNNSALRRTVYFSQEFVQRFSRYFCEFWFDQKYCSMTESSVQPAHER